MALHTLSSQVQNCGNRICSCSIGGLYNFKNLATTWNKFSPLHFTFDTVTSHPFTMMNVETLIATFHLLGMWLAFLRAFIQPVVHPILQDGHSIHWIVLCTSERGSIQQMKWISSWSKWSFRRLICSLRIKVGKWLERLTRGFTATFRDRPKRKISIFNNFYCRTKTFNIV